MFFSGEDLPTTEFKLFDNVTDLLKSVSITLLFALIVRDYLHMKETWENETIIICGFNFFGMSECSDTFGKIFFVSFRFCFVFLPGMWLSQTKELHLLQWFVQNSSGLSLAAARLGSAGTRYWTRPAMIKHLLEKF